jgi:hypothetical protein
MFIRRAARAIIDDINNNPLHWNTDQHFSGKHYLFIKGELSIWVSHGAGSIELYRPFGCGIGGVEAFNCFEKRAIYKAYKKWLSKKIVESLKQ